MPINQSRAALLPALAIVGLLLVVTSRTFAQDTAATSTVPASKQSKPAVAPTAQMASFCLGKVTGGRCRARLLSEAGLHARLLRPTRLRALDRGPAQPPDTALLRQPGTLLTFELGVLTDVSARSALGASFVLAVESDIVAERAITGVKARYQHRLTNDGLALDLGAGVESRPSPWYADETHTLGLTADAAINHRDIVAGVLRYDQLRLDGRIKPELSLGVRLGGKAGASATAGILLTVVTLYGIFVFGYEEGT